MSNSIWKDPLSNAPAVGTPVWLKRILVNTHPFHATLTGLAGNAYTCGPNNWPILDGWLWSWKPLPLPDIPAPLPPIPGSGYRDVLYYPPPDAQLCWVRRFPDDCPAQSATWHADTLEFHVTGHNVVLPWYACAAWKPHAARATSTCNGSVTAGEGCGGVRPSSGAASTEPAGARDSITSPALSNIAAPEDGRTPESSPPASLAHYINLISQRSIPITIN